MNTELYITDGRFHIGITPMGDGVGIDITNGMQILLCKHVKTEDLAKLLIEALRPALPPPDMRAGGGE
jgi:hypothetical protein